MTISLERAAQCIGRRVKHADGVEMTGRVVRTDELDVWVETDQGDTVPCIPENLEWVSSLPPDIIDAINNWAPFDSVQIGFAPMSWGEIEDDMLPFPGVGIVYSGRLANDDDLPHPLYAIAQHIRQVHLLRINANPDIAREIEELLGWANP